MEQVAKKSTTSYPFPCLMCTVTQVWERNTRNFNGLFVTISGKIGAES